MMTGHVRCALTDTGHSEPLLVNLPSSCALRKYALTTPSRGIPRRHCAMCSLRYCIWLAGYVDLTVFALSSVMLFRRAPQPIALAPVHHLVSPLARSLALYTVARNLGKPPHRPSVRGLGAAA